MCTNYYGAGGRNNRRSKHHFHGELQQARRARLQNLAERRGFQIVLRQPEIRVALPRVEGLQQRQIHSQSRVHAPHYAPSLPNWPACAASECEIRSPSPRARGVHSRHSRFPDWTFIQQTVVRFRPLSIHTERLTAARNPTRFRESGRQWRNTRMQKPELRQVAAIQRQILRFPRRHRVPRSSGSYPP